MPALDLVVVATSRTFGNFMGEHRPQILMVTYILPACVPSPPSHKTASIDRNTIDQYAGGYECKALDVPLTISLEGDTLYCATPREEKGRLLYENENRFAGTSEIIGRFSVRFFRNPQGRVAHFMLQVGFGFWRFDRIS